MRAREAVFLFALAPRELMLPGVQRAFGKKDVVPMGPIPDQRE